MWSVPFVSSVEVNKLLVIHLELIGAVISLECVTATKFNFASSNKVPSAHGCFCLQNIRGIITSDIHTLFASVMIWGMEHTWNWDQKHTDEESQGLIDEMIERAGVHNVLKHIHKEHKSWSITFIPRFQAHRTQVTYNNCVTTSLDIDADDLKCCLIVNEEDRRIQVTSKQIFCWSCLLAWLGYTSAYARWLTIKYYEIASQKHSLQCITNFIHQLKPPHH
jgi:hypothetical protein